MKFLASACLLTAALAAAPQERRPLVGTVTTADGTPAAHAAVFLIHTPGGLDAGRADTVVATTDARGHFVARLLPQVGYSGFACANAAPDPTHAVPCSQVHEELGAGGEAAFRLDQAAWRRPAVVDGEAPWAAHAPLQIEVAASAANLGFLPLGPDGRTPPLPDHGRVLVRDRSGEPLWVGEAPSPDATGALRITLPEPRRTTFLVTDGKGNPVAGAEVLVATHLTPPRRQPVRGPLFDRPFDHAFRRAGTTGADGVVLVAGGRPTTGTSNFLVRGPDGATTSVLQTPNQDDQAYVAGKKVGLDAQGRVVVPLGAPVRLQLANGGVPAVITEARLTACYVGNVVQQLTVTVPATPGQDLLVPLPPDPVETMLAVRTPDDPLWNLQRVRLDAGAQVRPDLSWNRPVHLQFRGLDGGPARGLAGVVCAQGSRWATQLQVPVATDQAGRLARRLGVDEWVVFVADGTQWGKFQLGPHRGPAAPPTWKATIDCQPFATARVRALANGGGPVAVQLLAFEPGLPVEAPAEERITAMLLPRLVARCTADAQGWRTVPVGRTAPAKLPLVVRPPAGRDVPVPAVAGEEFEVEVDPGEGGGRGR